jgi:GT2 family glycosyltransferase
VAQSFDVRVIDLATRGGPARARNLGAREARGDILFFVDADVLVPPVAVGQVAEFLGQEPDLAAIFGSYDDAPAAPNFLSQYKNLLHHYVHQTAEEEASTFWSGCGAIRRDLFLDSGGFDVSYERPAIEDIELGYRLVGQGYRIRLCKALQVKHLKRWGVRSLVNADFFSRALPWTELILRDRRFVNDLNLRTSSRLSVILVYAFLGSLAGALWWPGFLFFSLISALVLLVLNGPVYRFFLHKRGLWFALRVIPWHWFYYFYSGLAFAIGGLRHLLRGGTPSGQGQPATQCPLPQPERDAE